MKQISFIAVIVASAASVHAEWKTVPGQFAMTRWAKNVRPDNVLPEYPRPQMARDEWLNLNGLWEYAVVDHNDDQPAKYQGQILVPFPIEAPLSGVGMRINTIEGRTYLDSRLWYRRTFRIPAEWSNRRILLHFGAVDWEATVYLNGKKLGTHRGGFDGFSFDVTDALSRDDTADSGGENELVVAVWDPTINGGFPLGKQVDDPKGIFYTPCTGIWQTVWIEPVANDYIKRLVIVPDVDNSSADITCLTLRGDGDVQVRALDEGKTVAEATGTAGEAITLRLNNPKLWCPEAPTLYDLEVTMGDDRVRSYFGMRKVHVGPDEDGITRIMLNNRFVLHNGVLDQGYWPDGVYTAPTDAALRYDIEVIKRLGFNMSRKHLKVEPERWYYWADKLGLLVWQDMPSTGDGIHGIEPDYEASSAQRQEQFGVELQAMIDSRFNHPSIVSWIVFNEGMGLFNSKGYELDDNIRAFMRRTTAIASKDKTRAINAESGAPFGRNQGWNILDIGIGQVMDAHCYRTTRCITPTAERASVIGEYRIDRFIPSVPRYSRLVAKPGISGLVWTQITDVEKERNGLLTYNRGRFKEDPKQVSAENAAGYGKWMRGAGKR